MRNRRGGLKTALPWKFCHLTEVNGNALGGYPLEILESSLICAGSISKDIETVFFGGANAENIESDSEFLKKRGRFNLSVFLLRLVT